MEIRIQKMKQKEKILCAVLLGLNVVAVLIAGLHQYLNTQQDIWIDQAELSVNYGEDLETDRDEILSTQQIHTSVSLGSLRAGVYDFSLAYETDLDNVYLCLQASDQGALHADTFVLLTGERELKTQIWLDKDVNNAEIIVCSDEDPMSGEDGSLELCSARLSRNTPGSCLYMMIKVLGICLLSDAVIWMLFRLKKGEAPSWQNIAVGLFCIVFVSSIGLLNAGWQKRDDTVFHMARIWGLAEGIRDGVFPVRIQPEWANGYGYGVSIFYSDFFLYVPAVLVLCKTPLYIAYKLYMLLINIGTALSAYFCFKTIGRSRSVGLVCSAMYTLSIYRMCNLYFRDAVGEYTAMVFLPVMILGMWNILYGDVRTNRYRYNWIILSLGMSGIIRCHVLSCEMTAIFLAVTCVMGIRKICRKPRFLELLKAVCGTILLNLSFLVPFLDYAAEDFKCFSSDAYLQIQYYGISLSEMFRVFGISNGVSQYQPVSVMAMSIGLTSALILCIAILLLINRKLEGLEGKVAGCLVLTVLALWMATDLFPYDTLQKLPGMKALVGSLQFPFRYLSIAMALLTLLGCLSMMAMQKWMKQEWYRGLVIVLCLICAQQSAEYTQYVEDIKKNAASYAKCDDTAEMESYHVLKGSQYLYENTDATAVLESNQIRGWAVVEDYTRNGTSFEIKCSTEVDTTIILPLFYYPDYHCWDMDTGEEYRTDRGDNNILWVYLPAGYQGTLGIAFKEPLLWRIAEIISLMAAIGYVFYVLQWRKRISADA